MEESSTLSTTSCVILTVLTPVCYSFGYCLHSHSLSLKSRDRGFGCFSRDVALFLGVITSLLSNFLYIVVLYYAPVSVLAGTFSLTLVSVAACSVYFLDDEIPSLAYFFGYATIIAEAIVVAIFLRKPIYQFPGNRLTGINTGSIIYWVILFSIMLGGSIFVVWFEKKSTTTKVDRSPGQQSPAGARLEMQTKKISDDFVQEANAMSQDRSYADLTRQSFFQNEPEFIKPITLLVAQNAYPTCLGIIVAGFAFLFNQYENLALNILWYIVLTFGMVTFIVLMYSRFEITAVFPVEVSVLTFVTVLSGLLLSGEDAMRDSVSWLYTGVAAFVLLGAIVTITSAHLRKTLNDRESMRRALSLSDIIIPDEDFEEESRGSIKSSSDPMVSMYSSEEKDTSTVKNLFSNPLGTISDPIVGIFSKTDKDAKRKHNILGIL